MKVAVASLGTDENAEISPVGGRAPYYLIFENGRLVEVVSNPFRMGGGGAGFGVAKMLADKGVNVVVVGRVGPNMELALKEKGIKVILAQGRVSDALKRIK